VNVLKNTKRNAMVDTPRRKLKSSPSTQRTT
jgi:hypothetical protein